MIATAYYPAVASLLGKVGLLCCHIILCMWISKYWL